MVYLLVPPFLVLEWGGIKYLFRSRAATRDHFCRQVYWLFFLMSLLITIIWHNIQDPRFTSSACTCTFQVFVYCWSAATEGGLTSLSLHLEEGSAGAKHNLQTELLLLSSMTSLYFCYYPSRDSFSHLQASTHKVTCAVIGCSPHLLPA